MCGTDPAHGTDPLGNLALGNRALGNLALGNRAVGNRALGKPRPGETAPWGNRALGKPRPGEITGLPAFHLPIQRYPLEGIPAGAVRAVVGPS
jgi:hypothetical protein